MEKKNEAKKLNPEALDITHPKKIDSRARAELEAVDGFLTPQQYKKKLKKLKIKRLKKYSL